MSYYSSPGHFSQAELLGGDHVGRLSPRGGFCDQVHHHVEAAFSPSSSLPSALVEPGRLGRLDGCRSPIHACR